MDLARVETMLTEGVGKPIRLVEEKSGEDFVARRRVFIDGKESDILLNVEVLQDQLVFYPEVTIDELVNFIKKVA